MDTYLKLIVLLYPDDTIIFAKTENQLLSSMNIFENYCSIQKLKINYDKTKILVFRDRNRRNRYIDVNNHNIKILDSFKFLAVILYG